MTTVHALLTISLVHSAKIFNKLTGLIETISEKVSGFPYEMHCHIGCKGTK